MIYKEIFSVIAIIITFVAFVPYIYSIIKAKIKPHVFSWIIWGTTTLAVFFAMIEDKGGMGTYPIGVSACITILIAVLAYIKRTDITISKIDWIFFILAMSSLPFWYLTSDPLWAVVILTTVDVLGFGPTFRKAYKHPYSESILFFGLFTIRNILVILALEYYSVTTILFPAIITIASILLIIVIIYRRYSVSHIE